MVSRLMLFIFLAVIFSCQKDEIFPLLGDQVEGPTDVSKDASEKYFFILNSDYSRKFNQGSLLVVDKDGDKKATLPLPRLGRFMSVSKNWLITGFDRQELKNNPSLYLVNISSPEKPALAHSFQMSCIPIQTVIHSSEKYFFTSCLGGEIYYGEINESDPIKSNLKLVRKYSGGNYNYRCLYLDETRNLLLGFVTKLGDQTFSDEFFDDKESYTKGKKVSDESNEVPDKYESDLKRVNYYLPIQKRFQFFVYDVEKESGKNFPEETSENNLNQEMRWLYYDLNNFDETPDNGLETLDSVLNKTKKTYRTNFWEAKKDPSNQNVFYLSQRGTDLSTHTNQIVKVTITGDLKINSETNAVPKTSDVMSFERVYGFKDAGNVEKQYPGDFEVISFQGETLLVVNHFKDLAYFQRNKVGFGLAATILGKPYWYKEMMETDAYKSYYQISVMSDGTGMSGLYYGAGASLFKVSREDGLKILKIIQ